jgi:hypothetical protein
MKKIVVKIDGVMDEVKGISYSSKNKSFFIKTNSFGKDVEVKVKSPVDIIISEDK